MIDQIADWVVAVYAAGNLVLTLILLLILLTRSQYD